MNDRVLQRLLPPAAPSSDTPQRWRFAGFEFDAQREKLSAAGRPRRREDRSAPAIQKEEAPKQAEPELATAPAAP